MARNRDPGTGRLPKLKNARVRKPPTPPEVRLIDRGSSGPSTVIERPNQVVVPPEGTR